MRFLRDEVFDFPGHYASLKFCNGDQATPDMVDMVSTPHMIILASYFGYMGMRFCKCERAYVGSIGIDMHTRPVNGTFEYDFYTGD